MSMRRNPFEEFERLLDRMSRQLEEGGGDWSSLMSPSEVSVDVAERSGEFVVTADLPGFEKDDIDLRLADHTLHLEAERAESREEESGTYIRKERRHESVSRSVRIPEPVDEEGVSASFQNGVLTVTLPKLEPGEGSERIDIS